MENKQDIKKAKPYVDANGVTVERMRPPAPEPALRMNLSDALLARQQQEIVARRESAVVSIVGAESTQALPDAVAAYFRSYRASPLTDNTGGSQFNDGLLLFVLARLLTPQRIIESGTHRGFSSWLLRHACPNAELHSFDIDHSQLALRAEGASYHLCDWTEHDLTSAADDNTLIFFDDHISHARRIMEASARGFRRLLFDDNFPVTTLYATGGVPVPTVAMLLDSSLQGGEELSWTRNNKRYRYQVDADRLTGARRLISRAVGLPDVTDLTEYRSPSRMTYVELLENSDNIL